MRVLVVKLTSMGDALHLLPALSDLQSKQEDVVVDWMVEDSFAEIPQWHTSVERVIRVSTRRWRKLGRASITEFMSFWRHLRSVEYDVVIDAQGLMKSAVFGRFGKLKKGGVRAGFSGKSIKESPAAYLYQQTVKVDRDQHAIDRLRHLFASIFDYSLARDLPNYGLPLGKEHRAGRGPIMLFHGTTWPTKHLPDQTWKELADLAYQAGYQVNVVWGNKQEEARANWIASNCQNVDVLPKMSLTELAQVLASASGAIAVDTGLGHLAAALSVPCVSVYGSTDATLTGAVGENQLHRQSSYSCSPCLLKTCPKLTEAVTSPPCYVSLDAITLWQTLQQKLA